MIRLFINALAASAGGGLTYVRNVLPILAHRKDVCTTLLINDSFRNEVAESNQVKVLRESYPAGTARRFCAEQVHLPRLIRRSGADVLLSTGNFALLRSPVPQILLSRNALYLSSAFLRDVQERGDYRLWIDTKIKSALARFSIGVADCTIAPSQTFADELRLWSGKHVMAIHHGFDHQAFFDESVSLSDTVQKQLADSNGAFRILFVSHYNYYRNFETLIRALAIVKKKLQPKKVRLLLTCKLASKANPGSYQAETAAALVRQLDVGKEVIELGAVPYGALHHLYRSCDVYATPAYAETFAHPLVEAMASGLPVIASDMPVHHEICGHAAQYFPRFSAQLLAERIIELWMSAEQRTAMRAKGIVRSRDFSWTKHVNALLTVARTMVTSDGSGQTRPEDEAPPSFNVR
jgi:glycosyltransferase involved in cell wall biosynthesis